MESTADLTCLLLSKDAAVAADLRMALATSGLEATVLAPDSLSDALVYLQRSRPSFLVVQAPAGGEAAPALGPDYDVDAVAYPTLAFSTGPLDSEAREFLRRRGVLAVIERDGPPEQTELTLFQLSRSRFWFRGNLVEIPLEEVVSTLASDRQTALIEVGCEHLAEITAAASRIPGESCFETGAGDPCGGATGRIYLEDGALLLAETGTLAGKDALRAMMKLSRGRFVVAECFLRPLHGAREEMAPLLREALLPSRATAGREAVPAEGPAAERALASKNIATPHPIPGDSMKKLAAALAALPASYGGTRCNLRGEVLSKTGNFDAETTAAAAAIAREALADVAGGLGLGSLQSWAFCHQAGSIFVLDGLELTITVGQVTKNPESVLRRMSANLAEMKP